MHHHHDFEAPPDMCHYPMQNMLMLLPYVDRSLLWNDCGGAYGKDRWYSSYYYDVAGCIMLLFQDSIINLPRMERHYRNYAWYRNPWYYNRTQTPAYGTGRAGIMTTTEKRKHGAVIRTNPGHDSPRKNQGCRLFRGIIREWNPNIINKSGNINKGSLSSDGTIRQGLKGSASLVFNNHGFRFNSRGFAIRRDNR